MVDVVHQGGGGRLHCVVVTPEATVVDTDAEFIVVPLFDGELGIAPRHTPLIGRLGHGELRIRHNGATESFYVDGGFVQVANDQVSVLTSRAKPAAELDADVASEHLQAARNRPANSVELLELRERAVLQARAQLRLARRKRKARMPESH